MSVYRFKVIIEDYEDLFREIEIKASQSFEDFHFAILKAFSFDLKHSASFFYSDDLWHMEDEIAFKDIPYSLIGNAAPMIATKISQFIDDPHQRFIYVYRSEEDSWAFLVELIAIQGLPKGDVVLPRVVRAEGDPPKQYNPRQTQAAKSEPSTTGTSAPAASLPLAVEESEPESDDLQEDQLFEQIETMGHSRKSSSLDLGNSADEVPAGFVLDEDLSDDSDQDKENEDEDGDYDEEEDEDYERDSGRRSGGYDDDDY
ncbi:MAG: IS1096 element passenger TnpR family protein [Bacteroidota bacterium]|jgi:hypothetical protein